MSFRGEAAVLPFGFCPVRQDDHPAIDKRDLDLSQLRAFSQQSHQPGSDFAFDDHLYNPHSEAGRDGLRLAPGSDPAPAVNTRCAAFRFRLPKLPVVTNQDFERCTLLPEFRLTEQCPKRRRAAPREICPSANAARGSRSRSAAAPAEIGERGVSLAWRQSSALSDPSAKWRKLPACDAAIYHKLEAYATNLRLNFELPNQSCTPAETARALIVISEPARCWSQRGAGFSGNASGPSSRSSWACSSSRNPPTQAAQPAVACHPYRPLFPIKQRQAGKGVPPAFVISEGFGEHVLRRHPKRTTFLRLEEHGDDSTDAIPSMCQLRAAVL